MKAMTNRLDLIQSLRQLEELDNARNALSTRSNKLAALNSEIEELRLRLPTAILKHYDQRRARSLPTIAPVKRGVCGGCHISITRNSVADLHRSSGTIGVCENCGVFIYLDENEAKGPEVRSAR
jgi:predicted  nucleic acid-binding Zn-ribbon protein